MLNELSLLSKSIRMGGIATESWYKDYLPIPNIRPSAPCVRIVLGEAAVPYIESVDPAKSDVIRKFGNNQGAFPAMNLAPLYRVTDEAVITEIRRIVRERKADVDLSHIQKWCTQSNWGPKFAKKYKISMCSRPKELLNLLRYGDAFPPAGQLIRAARAFADPEFMRRALTDIAFELINNKQNIALALSLLFYPGKPQAAPEDDFGTLSVVLDTYELEDEGFSTVGSKFTMGLNRALINARQAEKPQTVSNVLDAFGAPYAATDETICSHR